MKCYYCGGQIHNHKQGCSELGKDKSSKLNKTDKLNDKLPSENDFYFPENDWNPIIPKIKKVYTSFLPLEKNSVAGMSLETVSITCQSQVTCRIQRFWIDELVANCFMIHSIRITHNECLVCSGEGKIFGNLFRSGRWPLTDKTDSIFGIDLSGWQTLTPAHRVTVTIENISGGATPFRGCFEVLCIDG